MPRVCRGSATGGAMRLITACIMSSTRCLLRRCLGALLVCHASPSLAQAQTPAMLQEPVPPVRLADNLYYVGTRGISIFLFTSAKGHVLLDAGFASTVPLIERSMESLGFHLRDVKLVLVGHAHPDHVAGLHALQVRTGARVAVSSGDASAVMRGSPDSVDHWPGARVSRQVVDGDTVRLGPWQFVAISTPGHTPGCTTWATTLVDHGRRLPSLFFCSTSVPGGTQLVDNKAYPSIAEDYARTFRKLRSLPCATYFHEHPQGFGFEKKAKALLKHPSQNPFTDPEGCRANIEDDVASFESALAKQQAGRTHD
jgi:metallo-beta-lactamase class B